MKILFFSIFSILLLVYLCLPTPPDISQFSPIPGAIKSEEPGDTYQNRNIAAYFTNLSRKEIIDFYSEDFKNVFSFLGVRLPFIRLNYPPEVASDVLRPYQQSYYLEELVYPLKGSLYINGWEPFDEHGNKRYSYATAITIEDKPYKAKITIKYFPAPLWTRLVAWGGIVVSILLLYKLSKRILNEK